MTIGSIRTVSKRWSGTHPDPDEMLIEIDRSNPVLGNRHYMKEKSLSERDRVIAAHQADLEADVAAGGPISRELEHMAHRVAAGDHLAIVCWCAPAPCHGDNYVRWVYRRVAEILAGQPSAVTAASSNCACGATTPETFR